MKRNDTLTSEILKHKTHRVILRLKYGYFFGERGFASRFLKSFK